MQIDRNTIHTDIGTNRDKYNGFFNGNYCINNELILKIGYSTQYSHEISETKQQKIYAEQHALSSFIKELEHIFYGDSYRLLQELKCIIMDNNLFRSRYDVADNTIKEIYYIVDRLEKNLKLEVT